MKCIFLNHVMRTTHCDELTHTKVQRLNSMQASTYTGTTFPFLQLAMQKPCRAKTVTVSHAPSRWQKATSLRGAWEAFSELFLRPAAARLSHPALTALTQQLAASTREDASRETQREEPLPDTQGTPPKAGSPSSPAATFLGMRKTDYRPPAAQERPFGT